MRVMPVIFLPLGFISAFNGCSKFTGVQSPSKSSKPVQNFKIPLAGAILQEFL